MEYQIIEKNSEFYVTDQDGNLVAPEGHISREEAQAHIDALQHGAVEKVDVSVAGQPKGFFIPITKIDQRQCQVWGWAATEVPDNSGEIMDYESSKPYWQKWSESTFQRSGGKSLGNLRSMHKPVAAGRLIDFRPDDASKGVWVGAEVVDEDEWKKVEAGVYTGFSVGGHYVKRWNDSRLNKIRYTAQPVELSLVDAPCIPTATFQMVKMDGSEEERTFQPGNGENILKAEPEDLEKFIPSSPKPVGSIPVPGDSVARMPNQDQPMPVNPEGPPSGEALAERHLGVKDLSSVTSDVVKKLRALADTWEEELKKSGVWEEQEQAAGEGEAEAAKLDDPAAVNEGQSPTLVKVVTRRVKVTRRFVKVSTL